MLQYSRHLPLLSGCSDAFDSPTPLFSAAFFSFGFALHQYTRIYLDINDILACEIARLSHPKLSATQSQR